MVLEAYAGIDPGAVVVKPGHTSVTRGAVLGAERTSDLEVRMCTCVYNSASRAS